MQRSFVHLLCLTKTRRLQTKMSNFVSSDQRTNFHRYNVHCSCFLAQASLFLLLVFFSSGFFAVIQPWRPNSRTILLWTVDFEMCLLLALCEAFIWAAIWGVNSNELILCSRGNSGFYFLVVVLMRASFIIAFDVFFQIDLPSCFVMWADQVLGGCS